MTTPNPGAKALVDRVALITGAARGIGLAIARDLAEAGATVVIADIDPTTAGAAAQDFSGLGLRARAKSLDVSVAPQVAETVSAIDREFGRLDILVNNACRARYASLTDLLPEDWDDTVDVCLKGTFLCSLHSSRIMRHQHRGKIINISSMAASVGLARTTAYAAAKGGVEAMTRVMAVELAPFNVQVNAVAPGPVDTDFSRTSLDEQTRRSRLERLPAGRFGRPDEIAATVLFLCSDEADWITGSVLKIDGGYTAAGSIERFSPRVEVPPSG